MTAFKRLFRSRAKLLDYTRICPPAKSGFRLVSPLPGLGKRDFVVLAESQLFLPSGDSILQAP
jgi:hypothetical protein